MKATIQTNIGLLTLEGNTNEIKEFITTTPTIKNTNSAPAAIPRDNRRGKQWSREEDQRVLGIAFHAHRSKSSSFKALARELGRAKHALECRYYFLQRQKNNSSVVS